MAEIRGCCCCGRVCLTSKDGTLDTCSVLTLREGTLVTLPDSTVREGGEVLVGGAVSRGESFSTSDAVVTCSEETDCGGRL